MAWQERVRRRRNKALPGRGRLGCLAHAESATLGMGQLCFLAMPDVARSSIDDPPAHFGFLMVPDYTMVTLSSAIAVLRMANRSSERELYRWVVRDARRRARCLKRGVASDSGWRRELPWTGAYRLRVRRLPPGATRNESAAHSLEGSLQARRPSRGALHGIPFSGRSGFAGWLPVARSIGKIYLACAEQFPKVQVSSRLFCR